MSRIYRLRLLLLLLCAASLAGAAIWRGLLSDLPVPTSSFAGAQARSILFVDHQNRPLYEAIHPDGNKHVPLPLEQIPLSCRQATLATEDSRFYAHPGVDVLAIGRAALQDVWQYARRGETQFSFSGASTLTQQLARNLYLSADERSQRTLSRKLREAWLAWRMERAYTKDELLALYLNTTYYGHFAVGIEAAAQAYFGTSASDLDLAQCALLAGLPQYPAGYNPSENLDAAKGRQAVVLGLMERDGYISAQQAEEAEREALAFAASPFPIEAPHFIMWVRSGLDNLLDSATVRADGLRVVTTLDLDRQLEAEAIVRRQLAQLRPCAADTTPPACDADADPARRAENAALVALNPADGSVIAMVGSPDYFDGRISGAVNAALSPRQPGSAIKPLTYAAAFDPALAQRTGRAPWTAATLVADVHTTFQTSDGRPYTPQNYDLRYHGPVTARAALANSYNIPAVKALHFIGVEALLEQAQMLGIPWRAAGAPASSSPDTTEGSESAEYGLALTLGGAEVRLLDLTAAYSALANGGERIIPHGILRIETLDGDVLYDASEDAALRPVPALDPRVAFLITDILSDNLARLPAFGPGNPLELDRPAAAKTGTTSDWRDNWTVGYVPQMATGVWVGNADNTAMQDISGISGAAPMWRDFMLSALQTEPVLPFEAPDGLLRLEVCADSGLLPGPLPTIHAPDRPVTCPFRRLEWFIAGTQPVDVDRAHIESEIDARSGRSANADTPLEYTIRDTYWVLPAELQSWARENDFPQPPDRMSSAEIATVSGSSSPELTFISPDPSRVFRLDPALPADAQEIPLVVQAGGPLGSTVTLLVDGKMLGTVAAPDYTAWWPLKFGVHTLEARAISADGAPLASAPVTIRVVK